MTYFSDRERGPRPRIQEEITEAAWGGIIVAIESRIADGSFGYRFPLECPDDRGTYGSNEYLFTASLEAEIPDIRWPSGKQNVPPTLAILDLLEFCHRTVAKPVPYERHPFFGHQHLRFNSEEGQVDFRENVNRILARNGLAYELHASGEVTRLVAPVLHEALTTAVFKTGDLELNSLLEAARSKFLSPDTVIRRESLEKLWDAWERLKTLEQGKDKKESVAALIYRATSEPNFFSALDNEANELTRIGNKFRIRHSEVTQIALERDEHVDYLFHRMFSLIQLLLRTTDRLGG